MNGNIVTDEIKITIKCSHDEMVFLGIKIVSTSIACKNVITIEMCSKKRTVTSMSAQIHVTDKAIEDSTRTKIYRSWFSQIWSTHMCRLTSQMPHVT